MKRILSLIIPVAALALAPAAHALTPKPNVAPVISAPIPASTQHNQTTRVIDMTPYFRDPDASAAVQLDTPLGTMKFTLDGEQTPLTVANFLRYLNEGRYFLADPAAGGALAPTFFTARSRICDPGRRLHRHGEPQRARVESRPGVAVRSSKIQPYPKRALYLERARHNRDGESRGRSKQCHQ
jgi:hypothetical protein